MAANQLGKNSVGPKQLKKNAVTAAKSKKRGHDGEDQEQRNHGSQAYEDRVARCLTKPTSGAKTELGYDVCDSSRRIAWEDQYPYYTGFWAASADGQYLTHGDVVNAVNVYGSQCAFWVEATNAP